MQQLQLGIFFAAMTALVVCGCIFTRKPKQKLPTNIVVPPTLLARADEVKSGH